MNIIKLGNTDINVVYLREDLNLDNEEIITVCSTLNRKVFWVKNDDIATLYLWEHKSNYKVITTFSNIDLETLRIDCLNDNFLTYQYFKDEKNYHVKCLEFVTPNFITRVKMKTKTKIKETNKKFNYFWGLWKTEVSG